MKDSIKREKGIRVFLLPMIIIALLTAIDQLTKYMVQTSLQLYESKTVIDGLLSFTYVQNKGMAWGLFQGKIPVFAIVTVIIMILSFRVLYNVVDNKRYRYVKYVVITIIAGGLGNFIDRVTLGYVVDFFEVEFVEFPVFNVADIYVTLGMFAMMIALFVYKNEELDEILRFSFKVKNEAEDLEELEETEDLEDNKEAVDE